MRWNMLDLVLVVGCLAASLALWRAYLDFVPSQDIDFPPRLYRHLTATPTVLGPLTFAAMTLAMVRTPRERWSSHPAVVVGLYVLATLLVNARFWYNQYRSIQPMGVARYLPSTVQSDLETWLREAAIAIVAASFAAVVCGRVRRPADPLEAAGWILGASWVAAFVGVHAIYFI